MSERPSLEGYRGQSVDELIALDATHRIDSIAMAFDSAIVQKAERVGLEGLSPQERTVLVVEALEREVNNGGYHQFFVNEAVCAPLIVDALHAIGCPKIAAVTQEAIDALGIPFVSVSEIENVIYDDDEERDRKLLECDDVFLEYPEDISGQLFAYIKRHRRAFELQ